MSAPTREEAEAALVRAIGHAVGKDIHDRIAASFENRLRTMDRALSKAHHAKEVAERNLERARTGRMNSQDRLHLASREMHQQSVEMNRLRAALDEINTRAVAAGITGWGPLAEISSIAVFALDPDAGALGTWDEADDMCPNCVTPWKCNGPHLASLTPSNERQRSTPDP